MTRTLRIALIAALMLAAYLRSKWDLFAFTAIMSGAALAAFWMQQHQLAP